MTYVLRTMHGDFEQTTTHARATDAVAALDEPGAGPTRVASIDKMGLPITEDELRRDADHETSRTPIDLPTVALP